MFDTSQCTENHNFRLGLTTERFTSSQEPLWLMLTGVVAVVVAELLLLSIDLKMF